MHTKKCNLLLFLHEMNYITWLREPRQSRYRILTDYIEPHDWCNQPDPLYYISARYNRAIESMVRNAPEQYLWLHRRWKSRPQFEQDGTPMPKRLRLQLESLPWLDETELETLIG